MIRILQKPVSAAPLAIFRIAFGAMLFLSTVRFWAKGWIAELYIKPKYFFPFYGFEFIKPLGEYTYLLFAVCAISALFVAFGFLYRMASVSLFVSFTYVELIDKSTYLNHYYFVSVVCFMLIFLPAHVFFSVDAYRSKKIMADKIPAWCALSLQILVGILYFYAGIAKLNSDWLLEALPLKIWLPARNDMPVIGFLFHYKWIPFVFSWFGCLYDLTIPFLLAYKKTRLFAFAAVVIFHGLTAVLFPIGLFPYIMIVTALIFFSGDFHLKIVKAISGVFRWNSTFINSGKTFHFSESSNAALLAFFSVLLLIQMILPFRYLLYPGELFWTEEGYRFSWRVMLMEKAGYTQFQVQDDSGKSLIINNNLFLTTLQEKMMSTQPDMILQYAHILRDYYANHGFSNPKIYVDSYVALNGRLGKPLVSPDVNLAEQTETFQHKIWITPLNDEIKGF